MLRFNAVTYNRLKLLTQDEVLKTSPPYREQARVVMHLDSGYTKISLVRTEGLGMTNGGIECDIPTALIPSHLRGIGSRFTLVMPKFRPEPSDSVESIRSAAGDFKIEEIGSSETSGESDRAGSEPG